MYQIIKYCRDCGPYSGREFGRKADAVRYARACVCPDWEYVAVISTRTKRVDVLKGALGALCARMHRVQAREALRYLWGVITTSYHDLLTMYGGEQLEAEQRVYIYVQQPKRYKTPEDIARKDADIARQIERMQRLIDDLRDYRVALAQRYAELETMPYTRVLTLKRDPSYKGRITYWVTITRRMSDGTETDELCEQFHGQDRAKAFARFAALQKQYPGIASVKDVARRSWE